MINGTLDMLVLKVLAVEPVPGWGITKRIKQASDAQERPGRVRPYTATCSTSSSSRRRPMR